MLDEEEEGEPFEFDDEVPEAERPPLFPPALGYNSSGCPVLENAEEDLLPPPPPPAPHGDLPPPPEEGFIQEGVNKELPLPEGAQGKMVDLLLLNSRCELYMIHMFF